MTFEEWFNSAPHRAKYSNDHPAYLAAQEAWEAAHEACAKVCDGLNFIDNGTPTGTRASNRHCAAAAIRARGQE